MAIIKKYEDKLEMPKRGKGDHSKGGGDPYFDQRLLEGVAIGLSFKLFLEGFWSFGDQELFFYGILKSP